MIIEYSSLYEEKLKDLMVELQKYIAFLDKEKYNILTNAYREEYFKKTMKEIENYHGKIFLFQENHKIVGFVIGIINNEEISTYDFQVPKRGRITELYVTLSCRKKGYGKQLLSFMENYLLEQGCKDILIEVFGYNEHAITFYEKNGYHTRLLDMSKKL